MRRKDREISDYSEIIRIIESCSVCRLGLMDEDEAYIVPMNFGYIVENKDLTLYFHSAKEGRKIDLMKNGKRVSFEMDTSHSLVKGKEACSFTFLYECVMGTGTIEILQGRQEKSLGLGVIMEHYEKGKTWDYDPKLLESVSVLKLKVEKLSAKAHL